MEVPAVGGGNGVLHGELGHGVGIGLGVNVLGNTTPRLMATLSEEVFLG